MWMLAQLNLKLPSKAVGLTCFYITALHAGREPRDREAERMMSDRI